MSNYEMRAFGTYFVGKCWRTTARIADLMISGNVGQCATRSANPRSVAALFAAPFAKSFDFAAELEIVRSLSWALEEPARTAFPAFSGGDCGSCFFSCANYLVEFERDAFHDGDRAESVAELFLFRVC